ncbi:aminotransferase class V-fold PLP-dependent enzyme [Thioalkalivibrio sp. HK1]|uniref:aminotransferase class V-fold PLP-dependent enzyme n=1 Tax=Thioalkalivibrio sp. HK1 TaxID=1469245 RepID=UPI00046F48F3|nr:aminotransferase class V-fold PLP-dependent enzyme [Thioalkalivibrio sp. HK1]
MKEHYYFDNASTSWPKPEPVYRFMDEFFRSYGVNPGRSGHSLAVESERMIFETRRLLAQFFGFAGDPMRVVFTQNVTDSLNLALFGLLDAGDHVITTCMEHNSVLRPLYHLERDRGVRVSRIGADDEGFVDLDAIRAALRPATKAVVINHGSNVLGSVQNLEAISAIARKAQAILIVDSAQSAGVLPIDMDDLGIGVLCFTGHKGLFGPMGVGGMIVAEGVDIRHGRVGGTGVDSISAFQPDTWPHRLEAGTGPLPGIAGLNAAQKWFAALGRSVECTADSEAKDGESDAETLDHALACRRALARIEAVEVEHIRRLREGLEAIDGVIVYGPRGNRPQLATLAFNIGSIPADQAGEMLDADYHLCVRAGLHCAPLVHEHLGTAKIRGAVRISPGYFTEADEIEHALTAIAELAR